MDLSLIAFKKTQNRLGIKEIETLKEKLKLMNNMVFYKAPEGQQSLVEFITSRRLRSFHFNRGNPIVRLDQFADLEELGVSLDGTDPVNLNTVNKKFN